MKVILCTKICTQTDRSNLVIAVTIQRGRRRRRKKAELPDDIQLLVKAASASDKETSNRDGGLIDGAVGEDERIDGDDGDYEQIDRDD